VTWHDLMHPAVWLLAGMAVWLYRRQQRNRAVMFIGFALILLGSLTHWVVSIVGMLLVVWALFGGKYIPVGR
jgi:hypothetical protein